MFLSKIWFVLVALFAGFALSIALTAPRPMAQRLEELVTSFEAWERLRAEQRLGKARAARVMTKTAEAILQRRWKAS